MLVLKDFSTSILAAPLSAAATSIDVGDASRFPALPVGSYFYAVLQKFADRHQVEIVKVVGVSGNTFSVERAQAGTTAKNFSVGDYIELRLTVATFDEYVRQSVAGKINSANGVAYQTLLFENVGDGVRSSFGVRFSDHHETIIGGAEGANSVSPSLHLRPLGRDNKTVEAIYSSDGVFSLLGGSAEIAARKLFLNSSGTSGWPDGAAASADNYARQWRSVVQANNSSLYLVGDGTPNARRFGFQVGNADPAFAHEVGVLELNPYGGDVRVNGGVVYHTNYRPTPAAVGAMPVQGSVNFDWTGIGSTLPSHFFHHVFSDSDPSVYVHAYTGLTGTSTTSYRIRTNNADISSYDEHLFNKNGAYFNGQRYFHEGFLPSLSALGAYPLKGGQLDGYVLAKAFVVAESPDGQNWVGIEAADGGLPYISAKHANTVRRFIEFNADGSTSVTSNLQVNGAVNSSAWGVAFSTIGGHVRSNNPSVMSVDGKTFSFVTSPADAHLCQNSYFDGNEWHKYDVSRKSAHLYVSDGKIGLKRSDAGEPDANQRNDLIYHTGFKPSPADIGAAAAVDVYSKQYVDEKGWMRVEDLRGEVRPPNQFRDRSVTTWFNETGNPAGGWYSGINVHGWADTYASWQLLSGADVPELQAADAYRTALWFRSGNGDTWGEYQKVYTSKHKPTSEDLGVIGINKKNYLNNAGQFGVGFISADVQGAGWIASYHGTDAGTKVVMGSLSGLATIGAHSPAMNEWADLHINSQDGVGGISKLTIIGNPYAKNSGDATAYRVYHEGYKPTAHGIGAAPDGFGVGNYGATLGTVLGDCNLRRQGGFFQGSQIEGIPTDGHTWKYVINTCHANAAGYFGYIAMDFDLNHAWLGGQTGGGQKLRKFVLQNDRFIAAGATGSDYNNSSIEIYGSGGGVKPTIGFHQPSEFAASIGLWFGDQFRFHTQGLVDYAGIMTGLANVSDIYIRSDVRLKTNFVEMRGALDKLSLLQAYYYDKKGMLSSDDYNVHELGLKAQDVEAVEPVAVRRVEDSSGGEILSISGSAINAMLVQALNELRVRVEELERNARS